MLKAIQKLIRFHFKYAFFNFREQFSDLASGISGFLLFPFFIGLIAKLWERFNGQQGNYNLQEVMLYIGVTETLYMTFLRPTSLSRASGDFSLSLARPRSWLGMSFSGFFGRCLGSRIVYLCIFLLVMPLLGVKFDTLFSAFLRVFLFLPLLGIAQALVGLVFSCAQVLWIETSYFVMPVSKIFLALGGVFGPLIDFEEPWKTRLLSLPPSDLFFQPAHYCVKGKFYQMSEKDWVLRIVYLCFILWISIIFLYKNARKKHQGYGG